MHFNWLHTFPTFNICMTKQRQHPESKKTQSITINTPHITEHTKMSYLYTSDNTQNAFTASTTYLSTRKINRLIVQAIASKHH